MVTTYIFGITIALSVHLATPGFGKVYTHAFDISMGPVLRTVHVGIFSIIIGQLTNIYVITKFCVLVRGRYFAVPSVCSTLIGDTLTTTMALALNFLGRTGESHIIEIIVTELLIMLTVAAILSFPATLIIGFLKRIEPNANPIPVIKNPFSSATTN